MSKNQKLRFGRDDYQAAFAYVCETFFPGWNDRGIWKLVESSDFERKAFVWDGQGRLIEKDAIGPEAEKYYKETLILGRCLNNRKVIQIARGLCGNRLLAIIIHEICHRGSWSGPGHWNDWIPRMQRAAAKAAAIGDQKLADLLMDDLSRWHVNALCAPQRGRRVAGAK